MLSFSFEVLGLFFNRRSNRFEITLKVGVSLPQAGQQATRENVIHMAQSAESEGFDSLWVFERLFGLQIYKLHILVLQMEASRRISDDVRPNRNASYVAADINKIALGTSFIDMLFHNPVVLARRFATLDVLSEGRAVAGFGIGWSKDEYQASNISFKDKGRRADKFIQVLKRIWTDEKGIATMTLILLGSDDIGKF